MTLTQARRWIAVDSPLGPDKLLFERLHLTDRLSTPFRLDLDLVSDDPSVDLDALLGKSLTVRIDLHNGGKRFLNGIVSEATYAGEQNGLSRYHATVRPALWLLTLSTNSRIFQEKTVPEIVKEILRENGIEVRDQIQGRQEAWNYCVQYRESDFNFISRLLEHEGIYYYVEHEDRKHTLVLTDSISGHAPAEGYETIDYLPPTANVVRDRDHIAEWRVTQEVRPASYATNDFDFETAGRRLEARAMAPGEERHVTSEVYEYPGGYVITDGIDAGGAEQASRKSVLPELADHYAGLRLQEIRTGNRLVTGQGPVRGLAVGALFTLAGFPRGDQNVEHLVVSTECEARTNAFASGDASDDDTLHCRFSAISSQQPFRPARITEKPVVKGPQTAVVVGPAGEEIFTDKYGRVKVRFHWDMGEQPDDARRSCWIRVSQLWAGKTWGGMFIPRIGQEVIVDFLEGDPDRPIITGRVYNNEQTPPYLLPDNATQSTIKSNSSKGGNGFNELRFEDKKDAEEVFFHAQKNFNRVVRNDDTLKVGYGADGAATGDPGSQTIDIRQDRTVTLESGDDALTIKQGKRTATVHGDDALTVEQGNMAVDVSTGRRTATIKGDDALTVTSGNLTIDVSAGKATITAAQSLELKVGASSIKIEPSAITLSAVTIKVDGKATTEVGAAAMLTLKGGLVKIN